MGNLKFYHDEPLFGLDIGHTNVKAMQINHVAGQTPEVTGYGSSDFDAHAIENGVIVKPEIIAKAMHELFEKNLIGSITNKRVACSLPTSRTFSRPMKLPLMDHSQIIDSVRLEAEQYIPIPLNNLYLDYEISSQTAEGIELLLVAVSKTIVDSYHKTLEALELEPIAFEPTINAASRLVRMTEQTKSEPAIIVDIGSISSDIAVYDKTLLVTSTVSTGGDNITDLIAQNLHLTHQQAVDLKNEYGISYSERQQRVLDAIRPHLEILADGIQKSIRYFTEHAAKSGSQIAEVITIGGGSVMPGLNQYLSKELRLPTHNLDPWQAIDFNKLALPNDADKAGLIIAAGEAMVKPEEASR
jgi:type IV pilus assembly protein PilM